MARAPHTSGGSSCTRSRLTRLTPTGAPAGAPADAASSASSASSCSWRAARGIGFPRDRVRGAGRLEPAQRRGFGEAAARAQLLWRYGCCKSRRSAGADLARSEQGQTLDLSPAHATRRSLASAFSPGESSRRASSLARRYTSTRSHPVLPVEDGRTYRTTSAGRTAAGTVRARVCTTACGRAWHGRPVQAWRRDVSRPWALCCSLPPPLCLAQLC